MEDNQIQQPQQNNLTEPTQSFLHRWFPTIVGIAIVVFVGGGVLVWQNFVEPKEEVKDEIVLQQEASEILQQESTDKVVAYLKENITDIVQAEPVLGATKFFVYEVEFYEENKLIATFEDGHVGGYVLGKYSVEGGEVKVTYLGEAFNFDEKKLSDLKQRYEFCPMGTLGWQIYRSEEFGFEIKYPRNWAVSSILPDAFSLFLESITFNEVGKEYNIEESPVDAIIVSIKAWDGDSTPLDLANKRNEYGGTVTQSFIDGKKAAQMVDYIGSGTYVIGNGHLYVISTPTGLGKEVLNVYGSMISTFKFTR